MRNVLYFTCKILLIAPISLFAQAGNYEFEDKETKLTERLELNENGKFTYTKQGEWANTKVTGVWKFNMNGTVVLNSDYQLDNLQVEEGMNQEDGEKIYLTLSAPSYKQGPRSVSAILLNESEHYGCQMMHEKILADAEERNRVLTSGGQVERDSAMNAYQQLYFECNAEGIDSLQSIRIEFDKKHIEYLPQNGISTAFLIQFNLAPDQTYRYFKDEVYSVEKKALVAKSDKKFKKVK